MPLPTPESLLHLALDAASSVAPSVREAFLAGVSSTTKSSRHDLVTAVDARVEEDVIAFLQANGPRAAYLGEERGRRGDGSITWIIDPIDGTSNFVHRHPLFAISIAACVDGEPVAAVVHAPATGEVFSAVPDAAWLGSVRLSPTGRGTASACALATDYPGGEAVRAEGTVVLEELGALMTSYATVRRPVCASLSLAGIAAGRDDVVLGVDVKPWDVAAAALIVTASGGSYDALSYANDPVGQRPVFRPCYVAAAPGAEAAPARVVLEGLVDRRDGAGYRRPLPY